MHKKIKFENMAVLLEFLVGSGLALFFHWVLDYKEAAFIIFGIGVLLSFATFLLREEMATLRDVLVERYQRSHEIPFAFSRITDADCRAKAVEILDVAKKTISMLQQGYVPFSETEFWLEVSRCLDNAGSHVKTVGPLITWNASSALQNVYHATLKAVERGVRITRIFVVERHELDEAEAQAALEEQARVGIDVRLAFRDQLPPAGDGTWLGPMTFDFATYDDMLVTDVLPLSGQYYGRKTAQPGEVSKFSRILDIVEHNAFRFSPDTEEAPNPV
ncbi:MAG TPA: hypothetical protein VK445_00830 [Dissulfurispiraceae bacterium]|nr:hypothetical protein [Dissulfurispiraceae bacterium]